MAVVSQESAPVKRMVQKAKEEGTAIDATCGRKTKAVLFMENNQIDNNNNQDNHKENHNRCKVPYIFKTTFQRG